MQIFSAPYFSSGNFGHCHMLTYSVHQSAIQKMAALKECSSISAWLVYDVSKKRKMVAYQKSGRAIQWVFPPTLQLRHSIHKVSNYQHPMNIKNRHYKCRYQDKITENNIYISRKVETAMIR